MSIKLYVLCAEGCEGREIATSIHFVPDKVWNDNCIPIFYLIDLPCRSLICEILGAHEGNSGSCLMKWRSWRMEPQKWSNSFFTSNYFYISISGHIRLHPQFNFFVNQTFRPHFNFHLLFHLSLAVSHWLFLPMNWINQTLHPALSIHMSISPFSPEHLLLGSYILFPLLCFIPLEVHIFIPCSLRLHRMVPPPPLTLLLLPLQQCPRHQVQT